VISFDCFGHNSRWNDIHYPVLLPEINETVEKVIINDGLVLFAYPPNLVRLQVYRLLCRELLD
jgi:hypothetical protein